MYEMRTHSSFARERIVPKMSHNYITQQISMLGNYANYANFLFNNNNTFIFNFS